jgi:NADH-quinone oxidoreductase subunit E
MSVRRLHHTQPDSFKFSTENKAAAKKEMKKFPTGRQASAVISLLWMAQKQGDGWVSEPAIRHVAEMLSMPYIRVFEVATFYTMFNLSPVGKHFVQFCGTTPCWLRGADALKDVCRKVIGPEKTISEDGQLSWMEVECLGACVNAPMVQINEDYYEDLDAESLEQLLDDLRCGRPTKVGPQVDRQKSAAEGGPTTLLDPALYNGKVKRLPPKAPAKSKAAAKTTSKSKTNFVVKATGKKKPTAAKKAKSKGKGGK